MNFNTASCLFVITRHTCTNLLEQFTVWFFSMLKDKLSNWGYFKGKCTFAVKINLFYSHKCFPKNGTWCSHSSVHLLVVTQRTHSWCRLPQLLFLRFAFSLFDSQMSGRNHRLSRVWCRVTMAWITAGTQTQRVLSGGDNLDYNLETAGFSNVTPRLWTENLLLSAPVWHVRKV